METKPEPKGKMLLKLFTNKNNKLRRDIKLDLERSLGTVLSSTEDTSDNQHQEKDTEQKPKSPNGVISSASFLNDSVDKSKSVLRTDSSIDVQERLSSCKESNNSLNSRLNNGGQPSSNRRKRFKPISSLVNQLNHCNGFDDEEESQFASTSSELFDVQFPLIPSPLPPSLPPSSIEDNLQTNHSSNPSTIIDDNNINQTLTPSSMSSSTPSPSSSSSSSSYQKSTITASNGKKIFCCHLCDQKFPLESSLLVHMATHTGKCTCAVCGKQYESVRNLRRHVLSHTDEKCHVCQICGKSFTHKCPLDRHLLTHSKPKPYSCDICHKMFANKSAHRAHIQIHSDNPKHVCAVCHKIFESSSHLKYHMSTHTGERAYTCGICGKSFAQIGNLKTHVNIHTGVKPFTCKVCGKGFTQNGNLRSHARVHNQGVS